MISDDDIDELSSRISVGPDDFDRTFARAQAHRDSRADMAVLAGAMPDLAHIAACFHYARDRQFLGELLRACIADQVAGPLSSPSGAAFAEICRTRAGVPAQLDREAVAAAMAAMRGNVVDDGRQVGGGGPAAAPGYVPEARNAAGYDADAHQMVAQLQSTMQMVCRIDDLDRQSSGTGVLIAPHLVATAAHVVEGQIDPETGLARPNSARRLRVRLDAVTGGHVAAGGVPLAEEWLAGVERCSFQRSEQGEVTLPPEGEAGGSNDVAVLRLAAAPGLQQGWIDVSAADRGIDPERRGLLLHHHPGGADQAVSAGSYHSAYGDRFKHSCSTIGGSSGGPLINHQARLIGLHNGRIEGDGQSNLGGGGPWLAQWWRDHPADREPDPSLNPTWEVGTIGAVGTGDPVIGFEDLQRRIWAAQLRDRPLAATVTISPSAAPTLHEVVREMLPPSRASVIRLAREELDKISAVVAGDPNPVTRALSAIADRIGPARPPQNPLLSTVDVATDAIRAQEFSAEVAARLREAHTSGRLWVLVGVGNGKLTTAVSEALGHLYRAVVGLDDGRGRLLVTGYNAAIHAVVGDLLGDIEEARVEQWRHDDPTDQQIARYMRRWFRETRADPAKVEGVVALAGIFSQCAALQSKQPHGRDFYGELADVLRGHLEQMRPD